METIILDFKAIDGKVKYMNAVNNGPTNPGVRDSYSNFEAYKAAEISYARNHDASFFGGYGGEHTVDVHRIFKNFDADENDPDSYVFEPTDKCLLNTIEAGTKIFYRLGASIEHGYKYGTYPPKDFGKWARICEHIIMHYNEGWANGYKLGIEYWEIWNEPDCRNADGTAPCWQGTEEEFIELYCVTSKYLKEKFPNIKIGGPAFCSLWGSRDFANNLLTSISERKAALDFFSFHTYTTVINNFKETVKLAREMIDSHGFCNTELILNEWNYVKGWLGESWKYTLKHEKGLKGAAFIASAMSACQAAGLDMLMYYDARPCGMNGMFENETFKPLKGYYPFVMFKDLLELGNYIRTENDENDIHSCAATDGENHAIMISHYSDNDEENAKDLVLECKNSGKSLKAEYYILDEDNDMKLVKEEIFTAGEFKLYLNMDLFTTYFIKFTKI